MRADDQLLLVKCTVDVILNCLHRLLFALFAYYFVFAILYIRTTDTDTTSATRNDSYLYVTTSKGISTVEKSAAPLKNRYQNYYRTFRFASISNFLAAMRSPLPLREIAQDDALAVSHSQRSRRHRNARQCSPLLCGDAEAGETGECPLERQRKQQMAESAARRCVQIVGDANAISKVEEVRMAANESYELFEIFCASRHLYCRPQPEIIPVNQLCKMSLNFEYQPPYAVLHRCPTTVPCCGEDTRCLPVPGTITNVSFSFYVIEASGPINQLDVEWHSVETFNFENHTACNCTQIKSPILNEDADFPTNVTPLNPPPPESVASNVTSKRKHVCTRCPKPFICQKRLNKNRCKCQCKLDDINCKEIMRGLRPLNQRQQKCVRLQYCFEPKCIKKLFYNRRTGKCVASLRDKPMVELNYELNKKSSEEARVEHISELKYEELDNQPEDKINDELSSNQSKIQSNISAELEYSGLHELSQNL